MKDLYSIRQRETFFKTAMMVMGVITVLVCVGSLYFAFTTIQEGKKNIYVMENSTALVRAKSADINDSYDILMKGQIERINKLIFQQVPDPENIDKQLKEAYTMSDKSVGNIVDALKTNDFYNNLVNQNYYTMVLTDSINVNYSQNPHSFRYIGKMKIVRGNQNMFRKIVTEGNIEDTGIVTENNERGFLIRNIRLVDDSVIQ